MPATGHNRPRTEAERARDDARAKAAGEAAAATDTNIGVGDVAEAARKNAKKTPPADPLKKPPITTMPLPSGKRPEMELLSEPKPPGENAGLAEIIKYNKAKKEWQKRKDATALPAGKQAEAVK